MLKKKVRLFAVAAVTAAGLFATSAPASADAGSGDGSFVSGNQIFVPITVPINACGNAVGVLGLGGAANGKCLNGAKVSEN